MPLRLTYRNETTVPVEVEGLLPAAVRDQSLGQIQRHSIFRGNKKVPLAECFDVSGDPRDMQLEFEGNLAGVHWIGAGMAEGAIHVAGNAGRHLGAEMTGGKIRVDGDAGDWVGGEMHGGFIQVAGRAGHLVGAAYRGSARGMTGGTILIGGDVGNEAGHTMRRGLLAVGGSAGDFAAVNMIAGSVFVFGSCGIRPAAGMRRGTLALFADSPPELLNTFRFGGRCRPSFLPIYLRALRRAGFNFDPDLPESEYLLYTGDLLTVGRGEILVRAQ